MNPEPTEELKEALRIRLNPNDFRQNAVVQSIEIIRARFLDDIVFEKVGDPKVLVPNDIDDFDLSSDYIQALINSGKTPQEVLDIMRVGEAAAGPAGPDQPDPALSGVSNPLRWQRSTDAKYLETFIKFLQGIKTLISDKAKTTITEAKTGDPTAPEGVFKYQDVKAYSVIKGIQMDMSFNNQASLEISLSKLREIHGQEAELAWTPRENDLLVITLMFPDGVPRQIFSGLITGVSLTKAYGAITSINVIAYGISKQLVVNKMVSDRAVITQFEQGEQAQTGLTPWSNYFANQTIDSIFAFLMNNEMGMQVVLDSLSKNQKMTLLDIERQSLLSMQSRAQASRNNLIKVLSDTGGAMNKYIHEDKSVNNKTPDENATDYGKTQPQLGLTITNVDAELNRIASAWLLNIAGAKPEFADPNQLLFGKLVLFLTEIESRVRGIDAEASALREAEEKSPPVTANLSYDMKFNENAFSSIALFQMTYLPLMTMALWNIWRDSTIAKFRGKRAVAYELAIRNSFNLFFSQLQSPSTVLNSIKSTAKYAVYENEDGQIVAELPRYNEFIADDGERIEDFIINNPMGQMEVVRQDLDLVTRLDSKQYIPMVDYLSYTFTSRQFTDIAVLSKYGMRTDAPIYNPNAISSKTAQLYAALEVTIQNANTRTMTMEHPADRKFKSGRLYFIAVGDLNDEGGGPDDVPNFPGTTVDGYVGYLNSFNINVGQGSVIHYSLNFNYVRKAKLLRATVPLTATVANFKVLPDLNSLIDALVKAGDEGKTDGGERFPPKTQPTSVSDTAKLVGNCYVTRRVLKDKITGDGLFSVAPYMIEKFPILFKTAQASIPSADAPSYQLNDGDNTPSAPIVLKNSFSGTGSDGAALTSDLAWTLYFLDARVRTYNYILYRDNSRLDLPPINVPARNYFRAIYIPSIAVNPWYYMVNPISLNLQIINPNVSATPLNVGEVTSFNIPHDNADKGRVDDLRVNFVGNPIDVDSTDYMFAIMMLNDSHLSTSGLFSVSGALSAIKGSGVPSTTVSLTGTVNNFNGLMYSPATIKSAAGIANMKAAINGIAGLSAAQKTRLASEVDFAVQQMKTEVVSVFPESIFLPIVIKGPLDSNFIVPKVVPGVPFTLIDIADMSPVLLPGNTSVEKKRKLSADEHAQGRAVDITLSPFYAMTGLALKPGSPYPITGGIMTNPAPGNSKFFIKDLAFQIPRGKHLEYGSQKFYDGDPFFATAAGDGFVPNSNVVREGGSTAAVANIFDEALKGKIVAGAFPTGDVLVTRLREEDRFWYHIKMTESVRLVNDANNTTFTPPTNNSQTPFIESGV
jgi:hypothetical protein